MPAVQPLGVGQVSGTPQRVKTTTQAGFGAKKMQMQALKGKLAGMGKAVGA